MAKRPSNRPSPEDGSTAARAQPKPRRQKATQRAPAPNPDAPSEAGDDAPLESMSMGSEPSEEDIRMRAYQRYLERGGGHGMDFEDWLEAERELKKSEV
jgi:hypothetical protein